MNQAGCTENKTVTKGIHEHKKKLLNVFIFIFIKCCVHRVCFSETQPAGVAVSKRIQYLIVFLLNQSMLIALKCVEFTSVLFSQKSNVNKK